MLFRVLGAVDVVRSDGVRVPVDARKPRVLLATLLLHAGEWVSVERLVEALWPEGAPPSAEKNTKTYVWKLRGLLGGERIDGGRAGYRVRVAEGELDAHRFEALVRAGRRHGDAGLHRQAEAAFAEALGLWRGDPFRDLAGPDADSVRARLVERRLTALEGHAAASSALGSHEEAAVALAGLVARHPFRERLRGALMTALYRAGRQAEALDVYDEGRVLLDRELGLRPGEELRRLHLDILNQDPNLAVDREPAPSGWTGPAQVPAAVVGFTGRAEHVRRLDGLLSRTDDRQPSPVAVITGTGGVGKTALAVHWAHRARDRFPDGQLYVDLRGYDPDLPVGPGDALSGFLRALGVDSRDIPRDLDERSAAFRSLLAGRRVLVVLDNARTAAQVRPLLPGSPGCLVLVTSRDSLRGLVAKDGATRLRLDLLPADEARDLLRALIGDRAAADPRAAGVLAELCARLPLALRLAAELATGRPSASLADLVGELTREQDRLDRLDDDADPHAALRSAFSWSYRQLSPAVARVFRLLGAHPCHELGLAAVAALTGSDEAAARRHVDVLVRSHLVETTADGRFQMHDLLRAYARGLAAEVDAADGRAAALHALADHYVRVAAVAMGLFDPADPADPAGRRSAPAPTDPTTRADAVAWLEAERANLLAVAEHAARHGDAGHAEELTATLWRYFHVRGHHDESLALHTHALVAGRRRADRVAEGAALTGLGVACERLGRYEEALRHHERAVAVGRETGDVSFTGRALKNLGVVLRRLGRHDESQRSFQEALAIARAIGNRRGEAGVLCSLALVHEASGRYEEALRHVERALAAVPDVDNDHALVDHLQANLGLVHLRLGRWEVAGKHLDEALAGARATGNRDLEAEVLDTLGELATAEGDPGRAVDHHHEALALTRRTGDRHEEARAHDGLARAYAAWGRPEDARRHRLLATRRAPGARPVDGGSRAPG
ncbi:tetratricopeptide repeat protein [Saccharothrix sp. 6-C]|uniref:AfsR/SARP family transcriptional regulator n=1 Tax=Saccharothrix sp. 6-C TaxID=2781735 RepID=UPI0019170DCF|nr:BTAD domain-containing putative transcriptional regulator [Saccharothrix sp. 6-C]QQQ77177.1 tetratricopeptide repeat protein [Saccharothrix sp. 6-C]